MDRDKRGRFAKGNPGGPGNPAIRRQAELAAAVRDAVSPDDLRDVLAKLQRLAVAGDVQAARVLLDRCLGRAREAEQEAAPLPFEMPDATTAEGCAAASAAVLGALGAGLVTVDEAKALSDLVESARRAIETRELADRVTAVERHMARDSHHQR